MDVADLRNPPFHWLEPFVGRGVSGGSAGSRSGQERVLRFPAPSIALGRVRIRSERRYRMLFFVGIPAQYIHNTSFYWKVAMVMLAGLNALYFTVVDEPWALGPGKTHRLRPNSPLRRPWFCGLALCIAEACCHFWATHSRRGEKPCHCLSRPFSRSFSWCSAQRSWSGLPLMRWIEVRRARSARNNA